MHDKDLLQREMSQLLAAGADQIKYKIDACHQGYVRSASSLAGIPEALSTCIVPPSQRVAGGESYKELLATLMRADLNLRGGGLVDLSGNIIFAANDQLVGKRLTTRQDFNLAFQGRPVISDIYVSPSSDGERATDCQSGPGA